MSQFMNERIDDLCDQINQRKENIITNAITDYLGTDQWTYEEVQERGMFYTFVNKHPRETIFKFDGVDLLLLIEPQMITTPDPYHIKCELMYRKLY